MFTITNPVLRRDIAGQRVIVQFGKSFTTVFHRKQAHSAIFNGSTLISQLTSNRSYNIKRWMCCSFLLLLVLLLVTCFFVQQFIFFGWFHCCGRLQECNNVFSQFFHWQSIDRYNYSKLETWSTKQAVLKRGSAPLANKSRVTRTWPRFTAIVSGVDEFSSKASMAATLQANNALTSAVYTNKNDFNVGCCRLFLTCP